MLTANIYITIEVALSKYEIEVDVRITVLKQQKIYLEKVHDVAVYLNHLIWI